VVDIRGKKVLVLGGYGLVGTAVCRRLLDPERGPTPREIQIHSLRAEESAAARQELGDEAAAVDCTLSVSDGDIFALAGDSDVRQRIYAQIGPLDDPGIESFVLYRLLRESNPDIVVDCVNTATAIAYRDEFSAASRLYREMEAGTPSHEAADLLLEALYVPRLIRHLQVIYHGLIDAGVGAYVKVGTTGTGGLGLNIPYTHSEERPSRVLLSKSAMAGAHSMLLCLLARTPGAPLVKEIKPAAAIAWKRIAYGPIRRRGKALPRVKAAPKALGASFSSHDESACEVLDEPVRNVFIDTGENGVFALEEFATVTAHDQMEFVTPEEIAAYLVSEIEGHTTGYDVIAALDSSVLGPSYRAGALRHTALEHMEALEKEHGVSSVAFEMLGPPRVSKLLFEAHLLRQAFDTMHDVDAASAEQVRDRLHALVTDEHPELADDVVAIGIPILLDDGRLIRGTDVLVPGDADGAEVTPERIERWARDGWADLRLANCELWKQRFERIRRGWQAIPEDDTSSRYHRNAEFWHQGETIRPGKVVGWVLTVEEGGRRTKR
jgi:hypothetical protein